MLQDGNLYVSLVVFKEVYSPVYRWVCTLPAHMNTTAPLASVLLLLLHSFWRWGSWLNELRSRTMWSWNWVCYESWGDCVIVLAPLIPVHFSRVITSSVCLSVLSRVSVLCFQIMMKPAVGGSSFSVLSHELKERTNSHILSCEIRYNYIHYTLYVYKGRTWMECRWTLF